MVQKSDGLMAFWDIAPKQAFHFLIVPEKHIESLEQATEKDIENYFPKIAKMARKIALEEGFQDYGYQLRLHVKEGGGQEVMHLHFHLLSNKNPLLN